MKPALQILLAISFAIVLLITGYLTYPSFFMLMLPKGNDIQYVAENPDAVDEVALAFGIVLACIPIATILTWSLAPVATPKRKILSACIIVATVAIFILGRREVIKYHHRQAFASYGSLEEAINKAFEEGTLAAKPRYEIYAIIGVIAGGCIASFTLKEKRPHRM